MANDNPELKEIARHLRDIAQGQRDQNRLLKDLMFLLSKKLDPVQQVPEGDFIAPISEPQKVYGWSMAALAQREGTLKAGDMKREQDDSLWVWNGPDAGWERVEEPSAREPD